MRMDITRWDPFRDMNDLQQGINQIFDTWRRGSQAQEGPAAANWTPPCDVSENENEIQVIAEIPGIRMEDIDLEVTADAMTIQGERKWEPGADRQWVRVERPFGRFSRSFSISVPIQVQDVKATYRDGVLTVTIPKSESVKPKRISVEAG